MTVAGMLPTMDDKALAVLHANAVRLMETGTPAQQSAALALMPSIKAELAARTAAVQAKKAQSRTTSVKRPTKASRPAEVAR